MKFHIINKGDKKIQMKGYAGKTSETKKFVKNPGGAQIIVIHENGSRETRHLKFNGHYWTDTLNNKYEL